MTADRSRLPQKRRRTSSNATAMPNTVLRATAQTATTTVNRSACTKSSEVSASTTGCSPPAKVRQPISPTGITSNIARYATVTNRITHFAVALRTSPTARRPSLHDVERYEHDERDPQQHGRDRGRARVVIVLDASEDDNGGDLRLARQVAGDQ